MSPTIISVKLLPRVSKDFKEISYDKSKPEFKLGQFLPIMAPIFYVLYLIVFYNTISLWKLCERNVIRKWFIVTIRL